MGFLCHHWYFNIFQAQPTRSLGRRSPAAGLWSPGRPSAGGAPYRQTTAAAPWRAPRTALPPYLGAEEAKYYHTAPVVIAHPEEAGWPTGLLGITWHASSPTRGRKWFREDHGRSDQGDGFGVHQSPRGPPNMVCALPFDHGLRFRATGESTPTHALYDVALWESTSVN